MALARRLGTEVSQVHDLALPRSFDRGMWPVDKAAHAFREPVISAGLLEITIHSLLHDSPITVIGDDKAVHIQLESVLDRGTVDLGD